MNQPDEAVTENLFSVKLSDKQVERFWSRVNKDGPIARPELGKCWIWTGLLSGRYGEISLNDKSYSTHRISYFIRFGGFPKRLCVCHRCDICTCVNPDHFFLGTNAENTEDSTKKGRRCSGDRHHSRLHPEKRPRGEGHALSVLNDSLVLEIRALYASGKWTQDAIAEKYGIWQATVHGVVRRKIWRHV